MCKMLLIEGEMENEWVWGGWEEKRNLAFCSNLIPPPTSLSSFVTCLSIADCEYRICLNSFKDN